MGEVQPYNNSKHTTCLHILVEVAINKIIKLGELPST